MRGNVIDFPKASVTCGICPWASACLGARAQAIHQATLQAAHDDSHAQQCTAPMKRNQYVVRQGDALDAIYVLRSGSAKSYYGSSDGLEQIIAFHYPGDLLGFDGIASGSYQSSIVALETAALCRIPFSSAENAVTSDPGLWADVMRAASGQFADQHGHALMLGQKTASGRFASFLLDVSSNLAARGCSRTEFNLSMARQDIANYLSLAVETISRLFGDLQAQGAIKVERRFVKILSLEKLQAIADDQGAHGKRATTG